MSAPQSTRAYSRAVARTVAQVMSERDVTQAEVARRSGVSRTTLGRRLGGESPFYVTELERIANVLDVRPVDLFPKGL